MRSRILLLVLTVAAALGGPYLSAHADCKGACQKVIALCLDSCGHVTSNPKALEACRNDCQDQGKRCERGCTDPGH